jgi:hypothetical protein
MAPTKFGDFGKAANDLFKDDFGAGTSKVVLKTKSANGTTIKVEGARNNDSAAVSGFVETTTSINKFNLKEKWSTGNKIDTEVSHPCFFFAKGKHTLSASFSPSVGGLAGFSNLKLKSAVPCSSANTNATFTQKNIAIDSATTFKGINFGGSATVTLGGAISATKFGAAFKQDDIEVASTITDGDAVNTSIYKSSGCCYKSGIRFGWAKSSGKSFMEVAVQKKIDDNSYAKLKVNDKLDIGVAYSQKVNKCCTATVAADVAAVSKVGFKLEFC